MERAANMENVPTYTDAGCDVEHTDIAFLQFLMQTDP